MCSLTENCLDGWDALGKKTSSSLEGVKGLQSLLKHLSEDFHKFGSETQSTCSKFKAKNAALLEGTVKAAVIAVVTDIETLVSAPYKTLADELDAVQHELGAFVKEREKSRKRLLAEAAAARKGFDSSLAALKKAREAYVKAAKDAATAQSAAAKSPEKTGKASAAAEKAKGLDKTYGDQLVATNDRQYAYYTEEQPALLAQVQQWEEARIAFVKKQLLVVADKFACSNMQNHWQSLADSAHSCAEDISETTDMTGYAQCIATNVSVPADIAYEPAPEGPSIGAPALLSSHASRTEAAPPRPAPKPVQPTAPVAQESRAAPAEQEEEGELYRALYDYEPENEGEMVMREGETLRITEKDSSGWWYAIADDGREGYVPSAYVEPQ